jgi:hypothetical protein
MAPNPAACAPACAPLTRQLRLQVQQHGASPAGSQLKTNAAAMSLKCNVCLQQFISTVRTHNSSSSAPQCVHPPAACDRQASTPLHSHCLECAARTCSDRGRRHD